jgi:Uma2 family endonuclease
VVPTAALVVEIVSPGDESYKKLDFYAAQAVDEVVIVDPAGGPRRVAGAHRREE